MDSFTVESIIRGYHIYEEMWSSVIEVLVCRCNTQSRHDPFAIAICKGTTVVRQITRWISMICYVYLGKPGLV